jgi:ornithine cyclodeaminase/alanine dehydrogenase-like protein (mu-crystallin family)
MIVLRGPDVAALSMQDAISAVENAYRGLSLGAVTAPARARTPLGDGYLWSMPALDRDSGAATVKVAYGERRHVPGALIAWLPGVDSPIVADASHLSGLRTGATLAIAIKHLASPSARTVGIVGTGRLAPYLLDGVRTVRPELESVIAYSRDRDHLERFAAQTSTVPADSAAECFEQDVVIVATTSRSPVCELPELKPGVLLCGIGANWRDERELSDATVASIDRLFCDYIPQARLEAADLIEPIEGGLHSWDEVTQLGDVLTLRSAGRLDDRERLLFKSVGVGIEDLAVLQALSGKLAGVLEASV